MAIGLVTNIPKVDNEDITTNCCYHARQLSRSSAARLPENECIIAAIIFNLEWLQHSIPSDISMKAVVSIATVIQMLDLDRVPSVHLVPAFIK